MSTFIISVLGYMLLFAAVEVNRKDDDSKIPLFSWNWLIVFILIVFGTSLIRSADRSDQKSKVKTEQTQTNKQMTDLVD